MKPRFGRRYGLLAAAVATSILLSGTTPAVAIPNPAPAADHIAPADPKVPTNKKRTSTPGHRSRAGRSHRCTGSPRRPRCPHQSRIH